MFLYPPSTHFGKAVPKTRIHAAVHSNKRIKELFTAQVVGIVWAHKLSPETLRLPAVPAVPEIEIFDLTLKAENLDEEVLHAIDRAIPYPVIHRLHSENRIAFSAAFKRPSEADTSQWVVGSRFTTSFSRPLPQYPPLPTVLDLGRLYAELFAPLLPLPPRPGENLSIHITRCDEYRRLTRNIDQLSARIRREKQFNRRVALNQELKPMQLELATLANSSTGARDSSRPNPLTSSRAE